MSWIYVVVRDVIPVRKLTHYVRVCSLVLGITVLDRLFYRFTFKSKNRQKTHC